MKNFNKICPYCNKELYSDKGNLLADIHLNEDTNTAYCLECHRLYNIPEHKMKILLRSRCRAIGDTIPFTVLIKELRRIYPKAIIDVVSLVPDIFKYNKNINHNYLANLKSTLQDYVKSCDLFLDPFQPENPLFPHHFSNHCTQYTINGALRKTINWADCDYDVPITIKEKKAIKKIAKKIKLNLEKPFIIIHPHKAGWESRTWDKDNWINLIYQIQTKFPKYQIVSIGGDRNFYDEFKLDNYVKIENADFDLYNKLTILESIALMSLKNAKAIITMDTAPLHIAACAPKIHIFGIFTVVKSKYRVPIRHGVIGYNFTPIEQYECSCTYDLKAYSKTESISKCPKYTTLIKTKDMIEKKIITKQNAINALNQIIGYKYNWNEKTLLDQINEVEKEFVNYKCKPTVDEVFKEFEIVEKTFGEA